MAPARIADELDSYLKLFEIFGLQFFSLKAASREKFETRMTFWKKMQIATLVTMFSAFGVLIFLGTKHRIARENILSGFFRELINYLLLAVYWINVFQSIRSTEHLKIFFSNSDLIADCCRHQFGVKMNFSDVRKAASRRLSLIMFFLCSVFGISSFFAASNFTSALLNFAVQFIFTIFLIMIFIKFAFYVCFVNYQLRYLHKLLHLTFENTKEKFSSSEKLNNLVMKKLLAVWNVYNKIIENASIVNKTHGLTMLITLVDNVLILTYVGYEMCKITLDNLPEKDFSGKKILLKASSANFHDIDSHRPTFSVYIGKFQLIFSFLVLPWHKKTGEKTKS